MTTTIITFVRLSIELDAKIRAAKLCFETNNKQEVIVKILEQYELPTKYKDVYEAELSRSLKNRETKQSEVLAQK